MSKNILIISTSLRNHSNSDMLADSFMNGVKEAGHTVEKISLRGKKIAFCNGCLTCQNTQKCVIQDDAVEIAEKMRKADIIVFATPIYYYGISGQMKTLLDRANPLFSSDYSFSKIYLLTTAAENNADVPQKSINSLQGWIDCFEKAKLKGSIFAGDVNNPDDINGHSSLKKAFEMGYNI